MNNDNTLSKKVKEIIAKESKYVTIIQQYAITTPINFKKVNLSLFINIGPKIITQMG